MLPLGNLISGDAVSGGMISADWNSWIWPLVLQQVLLFALVFIRLSGLMTTAPGWNHPAVPVNARVLALFAMALVITPNLPALSSEALANWDGNADGWLEPHELPDQLLSRQAVLHWQQLPSGTPGISLSGGPVALPASLTLIDFLWLAAGEFSLGLVLGWGASLVIAAMQLAGQMIDQQTGTGLGQVFNPLFDGPTSTSGEWLHWLALTVLFAMGGHLLILGALLETFRVLPVGFGGITPGTVSIMSDLVGQSLSIGLRISAPVLASQSLLSLAMGFLGHTVPQVNILVFGFPIRIFAAGVVLAVAGMGLVDYLQIVLPETVEQIGTSVVEPGTVQVE